MQGNLVSLMIGVMIFVVIGVSVTVPITNDIVQNLTFSNENVTAKVSGTNGLILGIVTTMVLVLIISVVAGYMA